MGSDSGSSGSSYDSAPMNYSRQKKQRKKEEARVKLAEQEDQQGYYARSGTGGNIVRSSSGTAVTSRAGSKVVDDFRSQEVDELFGSRAKKSDAAIMQMEYRRQNPVLPNMGILTTAINYVGDKNLQRMQGQIAAGGTPQFRRTASGRYVATGVNTSGSDDSSPNIANTFSSDGDGGGSAPSTGGTAARSASVSTSGETSKAARRGLFGAAKGAKQRLFY